MQAVVLVLLTSTVARADNQELGVLAEVAKAVQTQHEQVTLVLQTLVAAVAATEMSIVTMAVTAGQAL